MTLMTSGLFIDHLDYNLSLRIKRIGLRLKEVNNIVIERIKKALESFML